jgi:hypothetical protein
MARNDRTLIEALLSEHFPDMAGKSSDEWHGFLNAQTGLSIDLDEDNSTAFDKWRQALSGQGVPVWGVTEARRSEIEARGRVLKDAEALRAANAAKDLQDARKAAPDVSAKDLLK